MTSTDDDLVCREMRTQNVSQNLRVDADRLHPWYFYHVRVAAVNEAGVGPFHPRITVRMPPDGTRISVCYNRLRRSRNCDKTK